MCCIKAAAETLKLISESILEKRIINNNNNNHAAGLQSVEEIWLNITFIRNVHLSTILPKVIKS